MAYEKGSVQSTGSGKKALVTGSAGFIGQRVVEVLLRNGWHVEPFDIKLKDDILDKEAVKRKLEGCTHVIHLAGSLSENAGEAFEVNVKGTETLLECCSQQKIERFVFLSTCGVYGGSLKEPANEDTAPSPVTPYEKSKLEAEKKVLEYQELVPYTIVRAPLVMGTNEAWKKIVEYAKKGWIIGSGENRWQTVYVNDLAYSVYLAMVHKNAPYQTFIAAGSEQPTLKEIYLEIRKQAGMDAHLTHIPYIGALAVSYLVLPISMLTGKHFFSPEHIKRAVKQRWYDTSKITGLGFQPWISYSQGVSRMLKSLGEIK